MSRDDARTVVALAIAAVILMLGGCADLLGWFT